MSIRRPARAPAWRARRARLRRRERTRQRPALDRPDAACPGAWRGTTSAPGRCRAARSIRDSREPRRRGIVARALDIPVRGNELATERREPRAAAAGAADDCRGDRFIEGMIEVIEQQPRATIAHAELAGRLRERAARLDALEQRDLAGADRAPRTEVDPQPHTERGALTAHACDVSASRAARPARDRPEAGRLRRANGGGRVAPSVRRP